MAVRSVFPSVVYLAVHLAGWTVVRKDATKAGHSVVSSVFLTAVLSAAHLVAPKAVLMVLNLVEWKAVGSAGM
jgi:hypothetical protein